MTNGNQFNLLLIQTQKKNDGVKNARKTQVETPPPPISFHQTYSPRRGFVIACLPMRAFMPTEELHALVQAAISETGAAGPGDMGKVMKVVMGRVAGRAPNDMVSAAVRELLQK